MQSVSEPRKTEDEIITDFRPLHPVFENETVRWFLKLYKVPIGTGVISYYIKSETTLVKTPASILREF
jgi:hypothetical protein